MSFRILFVQQRDDRWFFYCEHVDHQGSIRGLYTGEDGRGLYAEDESGSAQMLLPPDRFLIPPGCGKAAAAARIAQALQELGWGPALGRRTSAASPPGSPLRESAE